jgi:hypothetical protein
VPLFPVDGANGYSTKPPSLTIDAKPNLVS